jgi:DNA-binding transcriptional regulator YiaG
VPAVCDRKGSPPHAAFRGVCEFSSQPTNDRDRNGNAAQQNAKSYASGRSKIVSVPTKDVFRFHGITLRGATIQYAHPTPRTGWEQGCYRVYIKGMRHLRSARHKRLIEEIAAVRQAAGISQRALAAKMRRSNSYISKIECGERQLSIEELLDLCAAIGVDPLALLGRVLQKR